jgi:hypothetical protein
MNCRIVPPTRINHCSNRISSVLSICHTGEEAEEEERRRRKKKEKDLPLPHCLLWITTLVQSVLPLSDDPFSSSHHLLPNPSKPQINPWNSVFSHLCAWVLSNSLMERRKIYATSFYDACSVRKA